MAKRIKATFEDLNRIGAYWTHSHRATAGGNKCEYFMLDKPLTQEQRNELTQFKNVKFAISRSEYAPELKRSVVILFDKCIFKEDAKR